MQARPAYERRWLRGWSLLAKGCACLHSISGTRPVCQTDQSLQLEALGPAGHCPGPTLRQPQDKRVCDRRTGWSAAAQLQGELLFSKNRLTLYQIPACPNTVAQCQSCWHHSFRTSLDNFVVKGCNQLSLSEHLSVVHQTSGQCLVGSTVGNLEFAGIYCGAKSILRTEPRTYGLHLLLK